MPRLTSARTVPASLIRANGRHRLEPELERAAPRRRSAAVAVKGFHPWPFVSVSAGRLLLLLHAIEPILTRGCAHCQILNATAFFDKLRMLGLRDNVLGPRH